LKKAEDGIDADTGMGQGKGRKKLRIDMASGTAGASEGSGLNIPM
jgi:hypothetical protein